LSFPSIVRIIEERGVDLETASETTLRNALWEAFQTDLPEGIAWLRNLVSDMAAKKNVVMRSEDPNSPLGRKISRLMGADIARSIVAEKLGEEFGVPELAFGFCNCCSVKVALSKELLRMTAREQVECQNGVLASADC
jgi:hypothetical protein